MHHENRHRSSTATWIHRRSAAVATVAALTVALFAHSAGASVHEEPATNATAAAPGPARSTAALGMCSAERDDARPVVARPAQPSLMATRQAAKLAMRHAAKLDQLLTPPAPPAIGPRTPAADSGATGARPLNPMSSWTLELRGQITVAESQPVLQVRLQARLQW